MRVAFVLFFFLRKQFDSTEAALLKFGMMSALVLTGFKFLRMTFAFVLLSALLSGLGLAEATAQGIVEKGAMTVESTIGGVLGGVIRALSAFVVVGTPCDVYGAFGPLLEASVAFAALQVFGIGLRGLLGGLCFFTGLALLLLLLFAKFLCGRHCHFGVRSGLCRLLICEVRVKCEDDEKEVMEHKVMARGVAKALYSKLILEVLLLIYTKLIMFKNFSQ